MPHTPIQVHVRLKDNFAIPTNTKPKHKVLGGKRKVCREDIFEKFNLGMVLAN